MASPLKSLGRFDNFFSAFIGLYAAFNSGHGLNVRQNLAHALVGVLRRSQVAPLVARLFAVIPGIKMILLSRAPAQFVFP